MFVGSQRAAAVARLLDDWQQVTSGAGPRVVFLSAPLGWGKTRIVQELYAHLAEQDGGDYWPTSIVSTADLQDVSFLTRERKRLLPEPFAVVGDPPYIWLAAHADSSEYGRPEEAYRALAEQLEPHLRRILRAKRLSKAAAATIRKALTAFIPLPTDLELYLDVGGAVNDLVGEIRTGRGEARVVGADSSVEQAASFWKLLSTVWGKNGGDGPPIVLAIEDAHFMSPVSVDLLRTLLTSRIPVLVVAAGWPVGTEPASRVGPFRDFLASAPAGLRVDTLDRLEDADVRGLVRGWHPGTPEGVVRLMSERTGGNPYALRLALIRLRAVRGRPIETSEAAVGRMQFDIHTQFESLLWALPDAARLALAATAILGYRLPEVMARDGLSVVSAGDLEDAISTDWLRADVVSRELIAFLEPLRHEVARRHGRDHFTDDEQEQVLRSGLTSLRRLLDDDEQDPDRPLLHDLHVSFAQLGIETDLDAVHRSAVALLRALRARLARSTMREVIRRVDGLAPVHPQSLEASAEYAVERARSLRFCNQRADPSTAPAVASAMAAVEELGSGRPDLQVMALVEKVRLHRDIDTPGLWDRQLSRQHLDRAVALATAHGLRDNLLLHNLRQAEYGLVSVEGDRARATALALAECRRTQMPDGSQTPESMDSLGDAAWYAARAGDEELAVDLSRQLVRFRTSFWGGESHPRVALAMKDLAVRLVRLGRDDEIAEAHDLCRPSFRTVEAAYGPEENSTLATLMARGYCALRHGLARHLAGDVERAGPLLTSGLEDCEHVLAVRRQRWPAKRHLQSEERVLFARAINGDEGAADGLLGLLVERRSVRGQPPAQAEVRWLLADAVRALRFQGRHDEADAAVVEHGSGPTGDAAADPGQGTRV